MKIYSPMELVVYFEEHIQDLLSQREDIEMFPHERSDSILEEIEDELAKSRQIYRILCLQLPGLTSRNDGGLLLQRGVVI